MRQVLTFGGRRFAFPSYIALCVIFLGACASAPYDVHTKIPPGHFGPIVKSETECLALNGEWGSQGISHIARCRVPTSDAGEPCRDHSECQSFCIAPSGVKPGSRTIGTCYKWFMRIGSCNSYVADGRAEWLICVD